MTFFSTYWAEAESLEEGENRVTCFFSFDFISTDELTWEAGPSPLEGLDGNIARGHDLKNVARTGRNFSDSVSVHRIIL